jgi:hypothetical protein
VVVLHACDYPTAVAARVLRRNSPRLAELSGVENRLIILDR